MNSMNGTFLIDSPCRFLITRCVVLWVCPFPFREPNENAFRQCTAHNCKNAWPISLPICDPSISITEFHWVLRLEIVSWPPNCWISLEDNSIGLLEIISAIRRIFSRLIYAHEGSNSSARWNMHQLSNKYHEVFTKYKKTYCDINIIRSLIINCSKFVTLFQNYYIKYSFFIIF